MECSQTQGHESLPPASITGRVGKFLMGSAQIYITYILLRHMGAYWEGRLNSNALIWFGVVSAFLLVSWCVNLGFRRKWGSRPFMVATGLALSVGVFSYIAGGALWSLPLGVVLWAVTLYVHGHMGVCHVLAALIGTPGCEMRALDHLYSMVSKKSAAYCPCPGIWSYVDEWEARVRGLKRVTQ